MSLKEKLINVKKTVTPILFRAKPLDQVMQESEAKTMKRVLGIWDVLAFGMGEIIGAGIFVLTGVTAHTKAGPAVILSYIFAGVACMFSALCYSEFSTRAPISGSAYTYAYTVVGEFFAWIIGWDLSLEYTLAAATVARGWSGYLVILFEGMDVNLPSGFTNIDIGFTTLDPTAAVIVMLLTLLLIYGIRESATFNLILTVVTLIIILLVDFAGLNYAKASNWEPFLPFGVHGIFAGASLVFFSYIGFDSVTTVAEEMKNPQKDLPRGIIGSLAISILLYVSVAAIVTLMVPYDKINIASPLASAFSAHGAKWAQIIISLGAFAALTTTILNSMLSQARIYYAMSRDGLLWPWVSKIHPKYQTPYLSQAATGVIATVFAFCVKLEALAEMVSIGTLLAFTMICACILWLHYREANDTTRGTYLIVIIIGLDLIASAAIVKGWHIAVQIIFSLATLGTSAIFFFMKRASVPTTGFMCPYVPAVPLLGIYGNVFMMANLDGDTWLRLLVWLLIGFVIYFGYSIRHSKLAGKKQDTNPSTFAQLQDEEQPHNEPTNATVELARTDVVQLEE